MENIHVTSIGAFIDWYKVRMTSEYVDSNPNMHDEGRTMNHYKVLLRANINGKQKRYTTYFSMGLGLRGEPQAKDVLDCLAADAAGFENARDFEDWASDYGYDTDSRKAEKTYRIIQQQAKRLKKFLGEDGYKQLLWDVERL